MKLRIVMFCVLFMFSASAFAASDQRGLSARPKAPTGEEVKGDLWLVTIGINSYLSWPRLKTAVNDAKAVKETLLKRYHLDPARVVELTDEKATRKNILGTFRDLAKKVQPDDSLLVYYAGHGHIDSITGKGSWIPVESGTDDPTNWISNRDITDYLNINAIKARHVLLVSDSCFSGDFFRGNRGALPTINDAFLKKAYTRSSRQAISSGGLEPVSDAGFGGNSVFSHFLVSALNNNSNPYLIPSEIFGEIKAGVGKNANQLPQFGDLHGTGGQDGGELILFLKGTTGAKLQDLGVTSAARQKELEQLKRMEAEAAAAKTKEQQEIARKQAELDTLDKQIAEMKSRLGTNAASSSDNLNSMLAMVEQKEAQARHLEELRKQREAEEAKRQQGINVLKQEAVTQHYKKLAGDIAMYQKIVQSQYGQNLKASAWDALIASYPAAKTAVRYDVSAFLEVLGLASYQGRIVTKEEKQRHDAIRKADEKESSLGLYFARVPAGCNTTKNIKVCADSFRMGVHEVTQKQWKVIMGVNPSDSKLCGDACPVENITRDEALLFINKLKELTGRDYRLPTEAEWVYACQAGKNHTYCGSDNADLVAWHDGNSGKTPHPVGQKQPNDWGLYDMTGNVWEFVQHSLILGSCFLGTPKNLRDDSRSTMRSDMPFHTVGFRLAAPID